MAHIPTFNGNAKIIPNRYKFGTHGCYFDGSSGYLTAVDNTAWSVFADSTESWTVECWAYLTTTGEQCLFSQWENASNLWQLRLSGGKLQMYGVFDGSNHDCGGTTLGIDAWHHCAFIKVGTDWGTYIDGNQVGYLSSTTTDEINAVMTIGRKGDGSQYVDGWMDDVRIQKSNIYSASPNSTPNDTITVPTAALSTDGNTQLSLDFNIGAVSSTQGDQSIIDKSASPHTMTPNGIVGAVSRFGGGAYSLGQATGDYLTIPQSSDFDVFQSSTDSWTIDCWFYSFSDTAGNAVWFAQEEDAGNYFRFYDRTGGDPMTFVLHSGSANVVLANTNSMDRTTHTWYHVAMCKVADEYGIYLNGQQIDYDQSTSTDTLAAELLIGASGSAGYAAPSAMLMDEIRYQHSNYFDAAPNSGDTDTITVPTAAYTVDTDEPISVTYSASTQTMTLAIQSPVTIITDTEIPSAFALALTLETPGVLIQSIVEPSSLDITMTLGAPTVVIRDTQEVATQELTLTIQTPTYIAVTARTMYPDPFVITASPQDALAQTLPITIPRYFYDPVVKAGCPQCGTYLYPKRGRSISTGQVTMGRNNENRIDDQYIRCGRCNFPVKVARHPSHSEGSRSGWGKTDTVQSSTWTA